MIALHKAYVCLNNDILIFIIILLHIDNKSDVPMSYADSEALQRDFGFTPKITLRGGLRHFAEWYKEYYG